MSIRSFFLPCVLALSLAVAVVSCRAENGSACDAAIPPITSGYGADGPYKAEVESVANPGFRRKPVEVYLPDGAPGKRPVIFFAHGYGPGDPTVNIDLIDHAVSRGYVVVFSSYPMVFASMDQRYDDLWRGFEASTQAFADRMDLTRVAFVGHSFGGGAVPAMAYHGIVEKGWGGNGAFLMELAPWYSFQITDAQLHAFPKKVILAVEAYEDDAVNDHRMGIDQYEHTAVPEKYYLLTHSETVDGCTVTSDHATPGRNPSLRLKQYAIFRPFDALADEAFAGSTAAKSALSTMGQKPSGNPYQPLELLTRPAPIEPENHYRNPWSSSKNPRFGH